jgi:hypothetical protein
MELSSGCQWVGVLQRRPCHLDHSQKHGREYGLWLGAFAEVFTRDWASEGVRRLHGVCAVSAMKLGVQSEHSVFVLTGLSFSKKKIAGGMYIPLLSFFGNFLSTRFLTKGKIHAPTP